MNRKQVASVLRLVREKMDWLENDVSPLIDEMNPEAKPLRAPDMAPFARYMIQQYPPEPFVYPDGTVVVASPWGLALREYPGILGADELVQTLERGLNS